MPHPIQLTGNGAIERCSRIVVVGAGGFGLAVADALEATRRWHIVGLVDDRWPDLATAGPWPVLATVSCLSDLRTLADAVVVAIGNNAVREAMFDRARSAGFALPAVIHPNAFIAGNVEIGEGAILMAGVIVSHGCRIGEGALINAGAVLDHDSQVDSFAHVGIAASLGGGARVTKGAMLPQGEILPVRGIRTCTS